MTNKAVFHMKANRWINIQRRIIWMKSVPLFLKTGYRTNRNGV
jgi:hypothetical protein